MPAADQANASQADPPGLTVSVSVSASQHLIIEVLRRPVEFTQLMAEAPAKDAVFFLAIVDDVALLLVDPPSNGDDEALQGLWKRKHSERAYQRWVATMKAAA